MSQIIIMNQLSRSWGQRKLQTSQKQPRGRKSYQCFRNKLLLKKILVILQGLYVHAFQFTLILELGVKLNIGKKISFLRFSQICTLGKHSDCRLTSGMLDIILVISEVFVSVNPQPNKSSSSRSLKSRLSVFKILNYPTSMQSLR